jgi:hypothetical protein
MNLVFIEIQEERKMSFLYGRYIKQYYTVLRDLFALSIKARREGLLSLEDILEDEEYHFTKIGLRMIVDGYDKEIVDKVLSFMIENEKSKKEKQLKKAIKQALLDIQAGVGLVLMKIKYNSFMDIHDYTTLFWNRTPPIAMFSDFSMNARIKKYVGIKYYNAWCKAVEYERANLPYVVENKLTHEQYFDICHRAVKNDGLALIYIKADSLRTEEWLTLYTAAVNENGSAIEYVNADLLSEQFYYELCIIAYKTNSNETRSWGIDNILSHINSLKCTQEHYLEICLDAVKKCGSALAFVDEKHCTPEQYSSICHAAIESGEYSWDHYPLPCVKPEYLPIGQYHELCLEAVKRDNEMLKYVQESLLGSGEYYKICHAAVFDSKNAAEYVRLEYIKSDLLQSGQYFEFCSEAIKRSDYLLANINTAALNQEQYEELCLLAITQDAWTIKYVKNPAPELLAKALENGYGLEFVTAQTVELCLSVVKKESGELRHVKAELFTQEEYVEICHAAIKANTHYVSLMNINDKALSATQYRGLCHEAIIYREDALEDVKISFFSPDQYFDICLESVQRSGLTLKYVQAEKLSKQQYGNVCYAAVEQDIKAFWHVIKIFCPRNIYRKCRGLMPREKTRHLIFKRKKAEIDEGEG